MDTPLTTTLTTRPPAFAQTSANALTSRAGWAQMDDESRFRRCMESIKTTNFVATGALDVPYINVAAIAQQWPGANFHMITFAAVIIRLVHPHTTCSIYPTGTMACMGAKTEAEAALALHKIVRILNKIGLKCRLQSMKIDNVVASVLTFPINLRKLHQKWGHVVKYADNFPGATMNCAGLGLDPPTKIVAEIFKSGKVNLTGAQNKAEIRRVYPVIHHILEDVQIRPEDAAAEDEEGPSGARHRTAARGRGHAHHSRRRQSRPHYTGDDEDEEEDDDCDFFDDVSDVSDPSDMSEVSDDDIPYEYNQDIDETQQIFILHEAHQAFEAQDHHDLAAELDEIDAAQDMKL